MGCRIYERIARLGTPRLEARVWIHQPGPMRDQEHDQRVSVMLAGARVIMTEQLTVLDTAHLIAERYPDLVNAVEVVERTTGLGFLAYNDWP